MTAENYSLKQKDNYNANSKWFDSNLYTSGQCGHVSVSNAMYQQDIVGEYTIVNNDNCDEKQVWVQQSSSHEMPSYISYGDVNIKQINSTSTTSVHGWFIGKINIIICFIRCM